MSTENQSITLSADKISFRNNDHGQVLCEQMYRYFKERTFCDVIIKTDRSKPHNVICAHRSVLSSHSKYFLNIFTSGTQLANQTEIVIKNISEEMLGKIVEYCYTGIFVVENHKYRVEELLNIARYFQIKFLEETCIKWLINQSLLAFLSIYPLYPLEEYSAEYRKKIFGDICEHFLKLYKPEEFLITYHLKVIYSSKKNMKLMCEALEKEGHNGSLQRISTKERHIGSLIMIISDPANFFEVYDPILNKSFQCNIMKKEINFFQNIVATVTDDDDLIVASGYEPDYNLNSVYKLNLVTMTWSRLPSMLRTRRKFKLVAFQNKIYAVGGKPMTNTVECWDPTTNVWKFVSAMSTKRSNHCVIVLDNKLYALGGFCNFKMLSTVECYDANLDKWMTKASMNKRRHNFSVGILNDFLYAFGGFGEKSVEYYDAKVDKWIVLHTIDMEFKFFKCISLLNCFIGTATIDNATKIVKYDPITNTTTILHQLKTYHLFHEVIAIPHIMLSKFQ